MTTTEVGLRQKENKILRLIPKVPPIVIKACDGTMILSKATEDVLRFTHYGIDGSINYDFDRNSSPTPETSVELYKLIKDANLSQMFNSFGVKLDKLLLTQDQIYNFCAKNRRWLRTRGDATFFLFSKYDKALVVEEDLFIAYASINGDQLRIAPIPLHDSNIWGAKYHHRVIVPKLLD